MLDRILRPAIDRPLAMAGRLLAGAGLSANAVTLVGLALGLLAVPALAMQRYDWALAAVLLNRLCDGLDGAVARRNGLSDFGGYLDIVADMVFYGAVVFGFALADPANGIWSGLLLVSFMGTSASFLAFGILAAKRGLQTETLGKKSFFYSTGLIEGSETAGFLVLACLLPRHFAVMAALFAALCALTVMQRVLVAYRIFRQ